MKADVSAFLNGLSPEVRELVTIARAAVLRAVPQAKESILWGGFSYHRPEVGGRVKGAVCQIVVKRGRVRLDFIHGIRLADPSGLLQGNQASKRFVPIEAAADAERPEIAALIREAAALDPIELAGLNAVMDGGRCYPQSLTPSLIAPCGMNCGLCSGYLRRKNRCPGCNSDEAGKPKYCLVCRIKNCGEIKAGEGSFCFACARFPCARLRQLDKRYRTKYGMSMIENLECLRGLGLEGFVAQEKQRWKCPECGGVICVHRPHCIYCGHAREHGVASGDGVTITG